MVAWVLSWVLPFGGGGVGGGRFCSASGGWGPPRATLTVSHRGRLQGFRLRRSRTGSGMARLRGTIGVAASRLRRPGWPSRGCCCRFEGLLAGAAAGGGFAVIGLCRGLFGSSADGPRPAASVPAGLTLGARQDAEAPGPPGEGDWQPASVRAEAGSARKTPCYGSKSLCGSRLICAHGCARNPWDPAAGSRSGDWALPGAFSGG